MKVLVAVEHKKDAVAQLSFITNYRWPERTNFAVISVVSPSILWDYNLFAANETEEYIQEESAAAEQLVADTVAKLQREYPDSLVEGFVAHGSPSREILASAARLQADAIIVGSKYKRGLEHIPEASISQAVVGQMPESCSAVYVVRAEGSWEREPQRHKSATTAKAS